MNHLLCLAETACGATAATHPGDEAVANPDNVDCEPCKQTAVFERVQSFFARAK